MDLIHYFITGSFDSQNLTNLDSIIRTNSIQFTIGSTIFLLILTVIAGLLKKPTETIKWLLFSFMILVISVNTFYLAGATIYKNHRSITQGPVHWHADFEIWNCGQKVDLKDPEGWSNKIGTPVFHEHNDQRMHVEGVVLHKEDVSLGEFFRVIGGNLTQRDLVAPLNEGMLNLKNGDTCNGQPGMVQAFVYSVDADNKFSQQKLVYPEEYLLSPFSGVPPGDCVIVEFDSTIKEKTDRMCQSFMVQKQLGKISEK